MDFTLATLLIVAAAVMLLAKYGGIHIRHQPASPALVPENSSEVLRLEYARLNRAHRCFAFLGLVDPALRHCRLTGRVPPDKL